MNTIPTLQIYQPVPPVPPTPAPISFPTPLTYEFQVVEYVDSTDKVTKVALQVKVNQHDQHGCVNIHGTWTDVPRVRIKL